MTSKSDLAFPLYEEKWYESPCYAILNYVHQLFLGKELKMSSNTHRMTPNKKVYYKDNTLVLAL